MLDIATTKQAIKSRLARRQSQRGKPADYEVLIIGAGIAGIGMACRLQQLAHKNLFGHKGAKNKNRQKRSVLSY
ncbi:hypothetical protein PKHYL_37530 [Psychrobacter sp. KH172YL61]|uniref:hypothetical protein n=1 Tax=Psychrobacter sp. KH172YL61 TaxID=2517899 RepID=UPI0010BAA737|nr:hypothetical protein [Psychrobacter sp. KH172YL61]BBI69562.1 hypothetical protein PKHYL_37530 [Psychrobacter sp. KH172YL61]